MKDRSKRPLATMGIGHKGRADLRKKRLEEEDRDLPSPKKRKWLADVPDDDDDENLPPPRATKQRAVVKTGQGRNFVPLSGSNIHELIEACEDVEHKLSSWEQEFVDSVSEFLARRDGLTTKQYTKLQDIVDRVGTR